MLLPMATIFDRYPPDRPALIHGDERWTYRQLDERSAVLAGWLQDQGVAQDDFVAFALPNGPDFMALTLGIYRAGATPAPLSNRIPKVELEAILETMRPRCFVTEAMLAAAASDTPPADDLVAASLKACTSGGSTGRPKVIVDGRPAGYPAGTSFMDIPQDGRVFVPGPLYHNASFSVAIFALWRGNTLVTMPRFDAARSLEIAAEEKIDWAMMVPTMLHRIMALPAEQRGRHDLSHWKMVAHTAAPMAPWLKRAWIEEFGPDHIWELYGATEALMRTWIGGREWLEKPGSVGRPIGGARIRILDPEGNEVPTGVRGEVYAMPPGGPGTSFRYIGAERRPTPDGWETVGDVGHVDADGYLFLADRKDDMIISGGINIWPAEVEAALLRHPEVRSCAVFGVPDADRGARVHALIETEADLTVESIGAFLADHLVRVKHPRSIEITDGPVRDDAGKFRRPRQKATPPR